MMQRSIVILVFLSAPAMTWGQSNSAYLQGKQEQRARKETPQAAEDLTRSGGSTIGDPRVPLNPELEHASLIAVKSHPPHEFKVHDLVTVIVREQKTYQTDSSLQSRKNYELQSELKDFFRTFDGHLAAATFPDGRPNIDYEVESSFRGEGDAERSDKLTFRITSRVIDIKPNGQLVLEARNAIKVDRESQEVKFTGVCRSQDVTPDNTVLSTQVFNMSIDVQHAGSVRNAAREGWLTRALHALSPF